MERSSTASGAPGHEGDRRSRDREEYAVGLSLMAIGLLAVLYSNFGEKTASQLVSAATLGPAFFPSVIGVGVLVFGAVQIASTYFFSPSGTEGEPREYHGELAVVFGVMAVGAAFMPMAMWLGIVVTTSVVMTAFLLVTGYRPALKVVVISLAGAVFIYLLFVRFLDILLPEPLLF